MASARTQRWALLLGAYNYTLCYKPGSKNANADALSRLPSTSTSSVSGDCPEVVFSFNMLSDTHAPINSKLIAQETRHDPVLSIVLECVLKGWPAKLPQDNPEFQPYFQCRTELSVYQDCLFWGSRVVIPPKYREEILSELHSTHPGIVKMKLLSRSYV